MHHLIEQFGHRAALLDLQRSDCGLDEAIANLAGWMELVGDQLSEDDMAVLVEIGGVLYREGLRRRMPT